MTLSDWAREMGIGYQTAWRWFKERKIEGAFQMPSGSIFVPEREPKEDYIVIYARVSSSGNKNNLDTQIERLTQYANARGYQVREDNKRVKGEE